MSCREFEAEIALEAGRDLEGEGRQRLLSHLAECGACRHQLDRLRGCLTHLTRLEVDERQIENVQTWQSVSATIAARDADRGVRQFNGWVAALATAAMLLAMLAVSEQLNVADPSPSVELWSRSQQQRPGFASPEVQPVAFPGDSPAWSNDRESFGLRDTGRTPQLRRAPDEMLPVALPRR
jgi:hypothetical protein